MNKNNFTTIIELARKNLVGKSKITFNELRRTNSKITVTADDFYKALKEHVSLLPPDLKFVQKNGVIDPSVVTDLEIEKIPG